MYNNHTTYFSNDIKRFSIDSYALCLDTNISKILSHYPFLSRLESHEHHRFRSGHITKNPGLQAPKSALNALVLHRVQWTGQTSLLHSSNCFKFQNNRIVHAPVPQAAQLLNQPWWQWQVAISIAKSSGLVSSPPFSLRSTLLFFSLCVFLVASPYI